MIGGLIIGALAGGLLASLVEFFIFRRTLALHEERETRLEQIALDAIRARRLSDAEAAALRSGPVSFFRKASDSDNRRRWN